MTITLRQLLFILGGTLVLIGALLGFLPVTYDGGPCGSPFGGDGAVFGEGLRRSMSGGDPFAFQDGCTDAVNGRRTIALVLLIPGAVLAGAGMFVGGKKATKAEATAD